MDSPKYKHDLNFIERVQRLCGKQGWRLVVYGGYGLDGYLRRITRPHGDIDLVIFGQITRDQAANKLTTFIKSINPEVKIKRSENPFQMILDAHAKGLHLNLYYVQTLNDPYLDLHSVIQSSGDVVVNDPTIFPDPEKGRLENLELEVQNQHAHFKDILAKGGASNDKYINDIKLIKSLH